jgi:molecular chaperone HtpG
MGVSQISLLSDESKLYNGRPHIMNEQAHTVHEYEYKAEMRQLLHLIIHSLYTHPEVFLRELISNASDALNKVRFMQLTNQQVSHPEQQLKITIKVDKDLRTFSIEDTGIGMTREDLIERIGTIASSGTLDFLTKMHAEKAAVSGELIGQFGVGFYSVFMVTDEVTIETRHASGESGGLRWHSIGEGKFSIEDIDRAERGTRIMFTLKEDVNEFADDWRIRGIIKKYSNFVDFPIFLGAEQVNTVAALWHRGKDEVTEEERNEFFKFIANEHEPPLGHLHLNLEGRVNFKALLFVPGTAPNYQIDFRNEKSLQLYANKVFIQDDCKELIPDYLRFLKGVVDTEDLPLNVSREVTQSSPVMTKIREVLTSRVLGMLEEWSASDPEKYARFTGMFGPFLTFGLNTDFTNRDKLIELLRFETTKTSEGAKTSFKEYALRMKDDQKEIYYLSGENRNAVLHNPNLEYFRSQDIEVILLTSPFDVFAIPSIHEYDKKELKSIEKADIQIKRDKERTKDAVGGRQAKDLLIRFKETLGDRVEEVMESDRLVDSAATLVVGKSGMDPQMERMMKMFDKEYSGQKKILELNMAHPLIKNLAALNLEHGDEELLKRSIEQLYESALLIENNLTSPVEFVQRMTDFMERATRAK